MGHRNFGKDNRIAFVKVVGPWSLVSLKVFGGLFLAKFLASIES